VKRSTKETLLTVVYLVFGVVAAIAAGYWIHTRVFQPDGRMLLFSVIVAGFMGSLLHVVFRFRGWGYVLLIIGLAYLLQVSIRWPLRASNLLPSAIESLPVMLAFAFSSHLYRKLRAIPIGKFLILAVLLAVAYTLRSVLLGIVQQADMGISTVFRVMFHKLGGVAGFKTGLLVGLALELVDLLDRRKKDATDEVVPGFAHGRILPPG
jgi:hypothetical protein